MKERTCCRIKTVGILLERGNKPAISWGTQSLKDLLAVGLNPQGSYQHGEQTSNKPGINHGRLTCCQTETARISLDSGNNPAIRRGVNHGRTHVLSG